MEQELPYTQAVGTLGLARHFIEAAARQPRGEISEPMVTYFLICHGLELAYKSVLIAQGTSESELRRIGHDLVEGRARALERGGADIASDPNTDAVVDMIAGFYGAKSLEYHAPGVGSLPDPASAIAATTSFIDRIGRWVDGEVQRRLRADS